MAVMSGRWRCIFLVVKAGHVAKFPLMMTLRGVDLAGLKHAVCRKMIKSAIVFFKDNIFVAKNKTGCRLCDGVKIERVNGGWGRF